MTSPATAAKSEKKINVVSSNMSAPQIIELLIEHGCPDVTDQLQLDRCERNPISGGGFGDVFRGRLATGKRIAIKCPRLHLWQDAATGKSLKRVDREIHAWSCLNHPNILELLGLAQFRGQIAMVSPWMNNGSLLEYINRNPSVDRYTLLLGVSDGVVYLHQNGIVHGDIKGANVLVSGEGIVKLADLGCTQLKKSTLGFTATTSAPSFSTRWTFKIQRDPHNMKAPEVLDESTDLSKEADVYALGMGYQEVLTGKVPFSDKSDAVVLNTVILKKQIPKRPKSFPSFGSTEADLLWKLMVDSWSHNPVERPNSLTVRNRLRDITPYKSELGSPLPSSVPNETSQQSLIPIVIAMGTNKVEPVTPESLCTRQKGLVPFPVPKAVLPLKINRPTTQSDHKKHKRHGEQRDENLFPVLNNSSIPVSSKALTIRIDDTTLSTPKDSSSGSTLNISIHGPLVVSSTPPESGKSSLLAPPALDSRKIKNRRSHDWSTEERCEQQNTTHRIKRLARPQSMLAEESGYAPDSDRKPTYIAGVENILRRRSSRILVNKLQPRKIVSESIPNSKASHVALEVQQRSK
ncbi:Tyrosine kinase catalytic domain protein [Ceratobasidium sp. AG-Ba]|nr:Tyrosine kinase catalytic domain protein [Ceratobasidium sp. AG-Ba]